jgi:PIN domain nuclease of toxin-antitoxin system
MARLAGSAVSSLNWSEVLQKLAQKGVSEELLRNAVVGHRLTVAPFTAEDARRTADLWPLTRSLGLSLADRACLALAQSTGRGVVTADRAWAQLDMGLSIFVIR